MNKTNVLVVDDEKEIRQLLSIYLLNEGYIPYEAENGKAALEVLEKESFSLVILDVMMPEQDGILTCIDIRKKFEIPIIFLSAKGEQLDKIAGLTVGADDYVTKPFDPQELIARVNSQLRRYLKFDSAHTDKVDQTIQLDDLNIKIDSHQVFNKDREVKLTPREFQILLLLAKNPGKVFSISSIYESVWKEPSIAADNTVMVHIRKLREKLEVDSRNPKLIKTVWGVGYKIDC